MYHIGLFEGIGGFSLAAKRCGFTTLAWCEIEKYQQNILRRHFPNSTEHYDITETDFTIYRGRIDVITGGFPCQDISAANFNGVGITGMRSSLWSHYARAIHEINPKFCIIENSPELLKKGFEKVLYDLSNIGYDAEWECISAEAFGFPHRRNRLFIIAYPNGFRQSGQGNIFKNCGHNKTRRDWETNRIINAIQRKTLPPLCISNNGFPERVVKNGIKTLGSAALHGLGNAVVPDIAEYLFNCIKKELT